MTYVIFHSKISVNPFWIYHPWGEETHLVLLWNCCKDTNIALFYKTMCLIHPGAIFKHGPKFLNTPSTERWIYVLSPWVWAGLWLINQQSMAEVILCDFWGCHKRPWVSALLNGKFMLGAQSHQLRSSTTSSLLCYEEAKPSGEASSRQSFWHF